MGDQAGAGSHNVPLELSHSDDGEGPATVLFNTSAKLFTKSEFVDCTISCLDGQLQAHRLVLASASPYLYNLLASTPLPTPCSHPILFLRNSTLEDARCAMEFIYTGKTQTSSDKLRQILEISQELGCVPLRKAIIAAATNCGIETFRRLSNTNGKSDTSDFPEFQSPASSETDTQNGDFNCPNIKIKNEIYETGSESENEDNCPEDYTINGNGLDSTSGSTAHVAVASNTQKRPKLSNGTKGENGSWSWKLPRLLDTKVLAYTGTNGHGPGNMGTNNPSITKLEDTQGESFVYTNEDLGMQAGMMDDGDEDEEDSMGGTNNNDESKGLDIQKLINGELNEDNTVGVPASCPWCLQLFTNLTLLQKHIKSHVGSYRPFTCDYCHNTFARSAHLKRHLRTHTGEKPYQCSICQRLFARQDKLKSHLERHLHNAAKAATSATGNKSNSALVLSTNNQVPIKFILPTAKPVNGNSGKAKNNNIQITNQYSLATNNNSIKSALSNNNCFANTNGLSISYASSMTEPPRSVVGGLIVTPANIPQSTTITPVMNIGSTTDSNDNNRRTKPLTHNFLVK